MLLGLILFVLLKAILSLKRLKSISCLVKIAQLSSSSSAIISLIFTGFAYLFNVENNLLVLISPSLVFLWARKITLISSSLKISVSFCTSFIAFVLCWPSIAKISSSPLKLSIPKVLLKYFMSSSIWLSGILTVLFQLQRAVFFWIIYLNFLWWKKIKA